MTQLDLCKYYSAALFAAGGVQPHAAVSRQHPLCSASLLIVTSSLQAPQWCLALTHTIVPCVQLANPDLRTPTDPDDQSGPFSLVPTSYGRSSSISRTELLHFVMCVAMVGGGVAHGEFCCALCTVRRGCLGAVR